MATEISMPKVENRKSLSYCYLLKIWLHCDSKEGGMDRKILRAIKTMNSIVYLVYYSFA
jgi:hypothetical protein